MGNIESIDDGRSIGGQAPERRTEAVGSAVWGYIGSIVTESVSSQKLSQSDENNKKW